MNSKLKSILVICALLCLISSQACKRSAVDYPDPVGPSTLSIILQVSAAPNVVFAGLDRYSTAITATLHRYDGVPLANETVHFDIRDATGAKAYVGYFDNQESIATRTTNSSGNITLTYHGPLAAELLSDAQVYIYAFVGWQGKEYIIDSCPIVFIRDIIEYDFQVYAAPNVLWVTTNTQPQSSIQAHVKKINGIPLSGLKVYFKILTGPGEFSDGFIKTFAYTNEEGIAEITYISPKKSALPFDTNVTIQAQLETVSPDYLHKEVDIRLIKGHE